jgi:hypothetical protein
MESVELRLAVDQVNQVRRRELRDDFIVAVGGEASGPAKNDGELFVVATSVGTCGLLERGMVNALPISLRVSLRTRTFIDGAIAGT